MTDPDKKREAERLAREAERLRTDEPFALAVTAARTDAAEALRQAEGRVVQAVLTGEPTGEAANAVRLLTAKIEAIDALCTEIAALIIRGTPRPVKPVA